MGWRSKFIFVLIVYFAGFATAIYCLAPAPETPKRAARGKSLFGPALTSDRIVASVNSGLHKCIDVGKEAAMWTAQKIKEKVEEAQLRSEKRR
jgi:hypothetical protein